MPKATFLNLSDEKRDRFVEAALEEFSAHSYDQASISRIVSSLGIAKGSLYQYFDGKRELFFWLLEEAGRRKQAAVMAEVPEGADLFERLRWFYLQGLIFLAAQPRWARLGLRAIEPSQDPLVSEMARRFQVRGQQFLVGELTRAQEAGVVREDADLAVAAHLVHGLLSEGLMRAFLARVGADGPLDPVLMERGPAEALAVIEEALALLRCGLSRQ